MSGGVFRADARVELEATLLGDADGLRELRRARGLAIELPAYVAIVGAGALAASAWTVLTAGAILGVAFMLLAAYLLRAYRAAYARIDASPESTRRCQLRDDGIVLESPRGRAFWEWSAVVGLRETPRALLVDLAGSQTLVLSRTARDADRVRAWLAQRVGRSTRPAKERWLLLLAVLYVVVVAATIQVLPAYVPVGRGLGIASEIDR